MDYNGIIMGYRIVISIVTVMGILMDIITAFLTWALQNHPTWINDTGE
jgi:hypothetical protein